MSQVNNIDDKYEFITLSRTKMIPETMVHW